MEDNKILEMVDRSLILSEENKLALKSWWGNMSVSQKTQILKLLEMWLWAEVELYKRTFKKKPKPKPIMIMKNIINAHKIRAIRELERNS